MKMLLTGCCGLVGSALVERLCRGGHEVVGIDNDSRAAFFGPEASTANAGRALAHHFEGKFRHYTIDIRDAVEISGLFEREGRFDATVHCAAQPAHDWAALHPLDDFHVNAFATVNLLETCRRYCPDSPFVFMSTNKVYGGVVDALIVERETRLDFLEWPEGIDESFGVDQCMRSLYGSGKLAADLYVQEYGRYYGMSTVCLRAGCITGAGHAAVPLHGFLSYLVKCNLSGREYVVKGFGGKQVRDNIHAADLAELIGMMIKRPPAAGSVYNIGGGKANSCSILEAFAAVENITGESMLCSHDPTPRCGDHACYYTDLRKVMGDYDWRPRHDLQAIYEELVADWGKRECR